jgi:prepilin-type N-terminal cleavage/methylation domain-containing protein
MKSSAKKNEKGMTLIEVMISLSIVTVMIGLVTGALANYLRVTAAGRNTVEIVGAHEKILRMTREDLRQSSSNRSSQQKWWIEDGGKTLRLNKLTNFTLDGNGNPILTWSPDIVYTLDADGFITKKEGADDAVRIAGNVTELTFTEIDNGRVQITLTNQTGNLERNTQSTLTTIIEVTPQN